MSDCISLTPELTHKTVLLNEAIEALQIKPDGIYIDCTFGRGGHSRLILQKLNAHGCLIALDKDPAAVAAGQAITDKRFTLIHSEFSRLTEILNVLGVNEVDGVLLDLGVSSPQLDEMQRGFSFRFDAPLDMRMNNSSGETAANWLANVDESLLKEVIRNYGEERFASQIASAIIAARQKAPIVTTRQLSEIIAQTVRTREPGKNPATRTFQAIRIYLNQELEEIARVLPQCVDCLKPGGRIVIISFHSLEDRMVKHFLRDIAQGDQLPRNLPIRAAEIRKGNLRLIGKAIRATSQEILANPRARSAVMRVAERIGRGMYD